MRSGESSGSAREAITSSLRRSCCHVPSRKRGTVARSDSGVPDT